MALNADLHFHPSFGNLRSGFLFSERSIPCLERVIDVAKKRNINFLAITSCSNAQVRDERWYDYLAEASSSTRYNICFNDETMAVVNPDSSMDFIFHGQEFKTDALDVNVLFANKQIPIRASKINPIKVDFNYLLDSARNCGENTIICLRPISSGVSAEDRGTRVSEEVLRKLYEQGKIDCFEVYDAMDSSLKNQQCKMLSEKLEIPGISVSDGHDLASLGRTYMSFDLGSGVYNRTCPNERYINTRNAIKYCIKHKQGLACENPVSFFGKGVYAARLIETIARNHLKKE